MFQSSPCLDIEMTSTDELDWCGKEEEEGVLQEEARDLAPLSCPAPGADKEIRNRIFISHLASHPCSRAHCEAWQCLFQLAWNANISNFKQTQIGSEDKNLQK